MPERNPGRAAATSRDIGAARPLTYGRNFVRSTAVSRPRPGQVTIDCVISNTKIGKEVFHTPTEKGI
jgi:hypothetical protein